MRGRWLLWSDSSIQKRMKRFVPCADEVFYLHKRKGRECDFFRSFCEEGHYGGRFQPTDTRQGIYCVAPSGAFLASVNSTHAPAVAAMLDRAWDAWKKLPKDKRYLAEDPSKVDGSEGRGEDRYPVGGLALRSYVRDLPRRDSERRTDWRAHAWNTDTLWFRASEAKALATEGEAPRPIAERFARFLFVDSMFGQTLPFKPKELEELKLTVKVTNRSGSLRRLRLEGSSIAKGGARGMSLKWLGFATWDDKRGSFTKFELVAVGQRTGGTRYNMRHEDPGPAPIGFVVQLAEDHDRVAPAFWYAY